MRSPFCDDETLKDGGELNARKDFLTPHEVLAIPKMDAEFGKLLTAMGLEDTDSFEGVL